MPTISRVAQYGTTSACAENTDCLELTIRGDGNYLRVRGEYLSSSIMGCPLPELPPRARRIRHLEGATGQITGTTSACAENTFRRAPGGIGRWNYLRVRGEYISCRIRLLIFMELPPRARRIHPVIRGSISTTGTTSACAENT